MIILICSVLGLSCVSSAFGATFPNPQPIFPVSGFQPAVTQVNPFPVQFPAPTFNTFQPSFQIPSPFPVPGRPSYDSSPRCHYNELVRKFATHYIRSLLQNPRYKEAYELKRVSKEKAVSMYRDWIRKGSSGDGEQDPDYSAYATALAVEDVYDITDSIYHMEVYAYCLGELLYQKKMLNAGNVFDLSNKYVEVTKQAIDENANPTSEQDLLAVILACERYIHALGIADYTTSYTSVAIFVDLWYQLRHHC